MLIFPIPLFYGYYYLPNTQSNFRNASRHGDYSPSRQVGPLKPGAQLQVWSFSRGLPPLAQRGCAATHKSRMDPANEALFGHDGKDRRKQNSGATSTSKKKKKKAFTQTFNFLLLTRYYDVGMVDGLRTPRKAFWNEESRSL